MPTSATSITLPNLQFLAAERLLLEEALRRGGSIADAAKLLGLTRHATKRRIIKHGIPLTAHVIGERRNVRSVGDGVVGD